MLQYKRGPRRIIADYKKEDLYEYYLEKYDNNVNKIVYSQILKRFFSELIHLMIFENLEYNMPARLGALRIKKKLSKPRLDENGNLDLRGLPINWKKTKEYWQKLYPDKSPEEIKAIKDKPLVRELNEHTDGYKVMWKWDKITCNIPNQSIYQLDMTREYDRLLSKAAKTVKNLEYYE